MQCTTVKYVRGGLNLESILVSGNQANAFESASSATGYHLDYSKCFLSSKITIFSCPDLTPPCLIPTQVLFFPREFPATVSHSRRCQRLTSISGNPDNGPHATLHTCSSAPGMSIRGSHRTKGCFSGCTRTPQCRPVLRDVAQLCVAQVSPRLGRVG